RLHYAKAFAESGDISTYDYTWLPVPSIVVGTLCRWTGGHVIAVNAAALIARKVRPYSLACYRFGIASSPITGRCSGR
ncbi:MAG: hypothetical protein RLY93_19685, partial [Sumerlaeia bacterium]